MRLYNFSSEESALVTLAKFEKHVKEKTFYKIHPERYG